MACPDHTLITAKDLYRLPDDGHVTELVRGQLDSEPLPGWRHGRIAANISFLLQSWARQGRAGEVVTCDTGFVLERGPDTIRGPDVAFVDAGRIAGFTDRGPYFDGAPTLAVEILSPGNRCADMAVKIADYLAAGTDRVWLVDPDRKTVAVYGGPSVDVLRPGDRLSAPALLPGFSIDVRDVFA